MFRTNYTGSRWILVFILDCISLLFPLDLNGQAISGDSIVLITLEQAIDLGVKNSAKLKSANLAVEIGDENIKQKNTDRLPDFNLGINGYLINDPTLYNSGFLQDPEKIDYTPYQVSGSLTASEIIYSGGRVKNAINQQVLQKNINEFLAVRTSADIKMQVIHEYLKLYTLLKDYEINVQTIAQIEIRLKTLRSKFLHGQVVKNDVSRSELQKSDFELKLLHTVSNVSATNYLLTLLLGLSENSVIQVDTSYNYASDTLFVFDDLLETAFGNRAEYLIAGTNKEISENTLKVVKGAYLPNVSGVGIYGLQNPVPGTFPPEAKFLSFLTIGVGVNYNLATFYKTKHQRLSAELAVMRESENIKDLQLALSNEVKTNLTQYELQRQSLNIYTKKIRFAQENYKIMQSRYYNDLALISEMVDAELQYNEARLDLIKGQVQTRIDYYRVLKAIGKL